MTEKEKEKEILVSNIGSIVCQVRDTPQHCMNCPHLPNDEASNKDIRYEDLLSDILLKQTSVTKKFAVLLGRREEASSSFTGPSHGTVEGNDSI